MKRISKLIGVLAALGLMVSFTGCSSSEAQKLSDAIIKNADVQTITSVSQTAFKVNLIGIDATQENKQVLDIINNISISATTKSDIKNNKTVSEGSANLFGMKVADVNLYANNNKSLLKLPDNPKYVELESSVKGQDSNPALKDAQMLQIQEQSRNLIAKFLKDYSGEYNFAFSDLNSKGTKIIQTPEDNKNVSLIQLKIDNNEFPKFIEYTLKNATASNSLKEYFKSLTSIASKVEDNQGKLKNSDQNDTEKAFEELDSNADSNSKEIINELSKYVEIGKDGIDITYGIDDQNNIVSAESKLDFIIKDPKTTEQKVEIELTTSSINYDLNKTNVNLPQFTGYNTIKLEDYVKNNTFLKDSPLVNVMDSNISNTTDSKISNTNNSNEISLIIGKNRAMVGRKYIEMDAQPYIEGEYTMVPVRFIGDALGADVKWDGNVNQVIYSDRDKVVTIEIGSNTAFVNGEPVEMPVAPIIKNGRTMVPVRFISEQLGAHADWNDKLQMVRIYK